MNHAITMGIFWHLIGAASAACFYAPFKKVKHWSWETMWSVGGTVSWLILPWTISAMLLPDFWAYYSSLTPPRCCRCFCSVRCGVSVTSTMA
jgi:L-rhamnose-H+ transport protein